MSGVLRQNEQKGRLDGLREECIYVNKFGKGIHHHQHHRNIIGVIIITFSIFNSEEMMEHKQAGNVDVLHDKKYILYCKISH